MLLATLGWAATAWASGDAFEGGEGPGKRNAAQNFFRDEYSVDTDPSSGSFSTRVEIRVPKYRGLEPKIALQYTSSGANGVVGAGWSLEGPSYIDRITPGRGTPTYDDAKDTYALDGQELVGSCTVLGGTHCTRNQSFLRINKTGSNWEVTRKDGTKATYTPLITPSGTGGTFRWALKTVVDTHNNTITYVYRTSANVECNPSSSTNDCYLATISYNGAVITFTTEARTDDPRYSTGRSLVTIDRRLKQIDVTVGQLVRRYVLVYAYSQNSARSLLESVQHRGTDGASGTRLPDLVYDYEDAAPSNFTRASETETNVIGPTGSVDPELLSGDYNGDGRTDFLYIRQLLPLTLRVLLGQPDATFTLVTTTVPTPYPDMSLGHWFGGDYNGDGCSDAMHTGSLAGGFSTALFIWQSNCAGGFTKIQAAVSASGDDDEVNNRKDLGRWFAGDFNGDGLSDFAHATTPTNENRLYIWQSSGTSTGGTSTFVVKKINPSLSDVNRGWWFPADVNGDGRTDIAHIHTLGVGSLHVYISNPILDFDFTHDIYPAPSGYPAALAEGKWLTGDFNGDGQSDLFQRTNQEDELLILFSRGGDDWDFVQIDATSYPELTIGGWWFPVELNGDGRTDLYHVPAHPGTGNGVMRLWHSTGMPGEFTRTSQTNPGGTELLLDSGIWQSGDINGDGRDDLLHLTQGQTDLWKWIGTGSTGNRLSSFTNRTGGITSVTYAPSTGWANDFLPVGMIMHPVETVTTDDGRGTSNSVHSTDYNYEKGLWSNEERCFLGFEVSRRIHDADGNYEETTLDRTVTNCTNPESRIAQKAPFGTPGVYTDDRYFAFTTFSYHPSASPPFSTLERERVENECNLVSNLNSCRKIETETFYDDEVTITYGNPTRVVEYGDLADANDQRTTVRKFYPNPTLFIADRPGEERIYAGVADKNGSGGTLEAETLFRYDSAGSHTIPPAKGDLTLRQAWDDGVGGGGVYRDTGFGYDGFGNLTSETSPRGFTTTTEYESTYDLFPNEVCTALAPALPCTYPVWEARREVLTQETDANGAITGYEYDIFGRPTKTIHPDATHTATYYRNFGTPTNQRVEIHEPDQTGSQNQQQVSGGTREGLVTEIYMDGFGREWKQVREGGITLRTDYHENSDRVLERSRWHTDPGEAQNDTEFGYDGAKRLISVKEFGRPAATKNYSNAGAVPITTEVDVLGKQKKIWRDGYGRIKQVQEIDAGTPYDTFFFYDTLGNLTGVTDAASNDASFGYDSLSQKRTACDFDLGCWTFGYDANGNLNTQTDARGQVTSFTHDAIDRVSTRANADGTTQWFYDEEDAPATDYNKGRLTRMVFPGGSQQIDWNNMGLQSAITRCVEGDCRAVQQDYLYGRLHTITYPDSEVVTHGYDTAGRLSSVSGVATQILWNAREQVASMTYANLVGTTQTYDPTHDALDVVTVTGPQGAVYQADYAYNNAVQITGISSGSHPKLNLGFGYDDLYRLKTVTGAQTQDLTYTSIGNILTNSQVGGTYAYHPTKPHAVTQAGSRDYTYDANGNLTSVTLRTPDCVTVERLHSYGADNRLRWVSAGGVTTSYRYDADGKRIAKTGPGGTTHYFGNLFEVEDPQGEARLVKYYYAGGQLLARQESGERVWYHQDHLGSVRAMTDDQGASQVEYEYAAFGDTIETTGAADNLRGYGAHWRDDESHLVYMGARYQDPVLGRFTQPDPVIPEPGDPQSWNRYSYVRNNPVNRIDPTGHADLDLGAAFGGAVAQRIGVNRAFGRLVGSALAGAVPGAGELADLGVLFSLDHKVGTLERLIATGSLVASVASLGTSPNVGSKVGIADEAFEAGQDAASRTAQSGTGTSLDELSEAGRALDAADKGGQLTKAGRALSKHNPEKRPGSAFPVPRGSAQDINQQGQDVLDDILTAPGSEIVPNPHGGVDVIAPDGRGVRFNENGSMRGLREP